MEFTWTNSLGQKCWSGERSTVNYRNNVLWHTETFDISGEVQVFYFVDGVNSQSVNGVARWRWTQVEQGTTFSAWSQNSNEVYNGQTYIDKNGVRVNQSNIGSYTEMHADGFFVKQNDGTKLFEASDAIRLYGYSGLQAFEVMTKENLNYGNAMVNLCGGINFTQKPSQDVGINMIALGNDDRHDKYGFHNLSIRCHNSLGFADNYGMTHMFFNTRSGRIIMKGALYQNTATPPSSFRLDTEESELYFGGYTKQDMVDSILKLDTATNVDADGDITMALLENDDDLTMTIIDEQTHVDVGSIVAGLVETVKMLKKEVDTLKNELSSIKTEF